MYIYIYICICVCMYVCMCVYIYIYIYTHTYIHTWPRDARAPDPDPSARLRRSRGGARGSACRGSPPRSGCNSSVASPGMPAAILAIITINMIRNTISYQLYISHLTVSVHYIIWPDPCHRQSSVPQASTDYRLVPSSSPRAVI